MILRAIISFPQQLFKLIFTMKLFISIICLAVSVHALAMPKVLTKPLDGKLESPWGGKLTKPTEDELTRARKDGLMKPMEGKITKTMDGKLTKLLE
jgi:hypothetical protein